MPQFHPAATASVPVSVAASAPPTDNERVRLATMEIAAAITKPATARVSISWLVGASLLG